MSYHYSAIHEGPAPQEIPFLSIIASFMVLAIALSVIIISSGQPLSWHLKTFLRSMSNITNLIGTVFLHVFLIVPFIVCVCVVAVKYASYKSQTFFNNRKPNRYEDISPPTMRLQGSGTGAELISNTPFRHRPSRKEHRRRIRVKQPGRTPDVQKEQDSVDGVSQGWVGSAWKYRSVNDKPAEDWKVFTRRRYKPGKSPVEQTDSTEPVSTNFSPPKFNWSE